MSCILPKLRTSKSAKPILKAARDRQGWTVDSEEPLHRASKVLDPNWQEIGGYFYLGVTTDTWKFFLYGNRKVDAEVFKAYCEVLGVKWQEIAEPNEVKKTELAGANAGLAEDILTESQRAIAANNRGIQLKRESEFVEARKQFELAIKLNPDNAASYYNLAGMYEEAEKFDSAIELYRDAAFRGFAAAYCKLARLYAIEYKDWAKAVEKSCDGLQLIETEKVEDDKIVKAALLTYLGWAWKEQGRWKEALEKLQAAVKLQSDRGLTYGIMAEVLENLGKKAEAFAAWKNCLLYAKSEQRDEDIWIGKARQRLG
jgi:tetratricopeptide (TPR) repeat protein